MATDTREDSKYSRRQQILEKTANTREESKYSKRQILEKTANTREDCKYSRRLQILEQRLQILEQRLQILEQGLQILEQGLAANKTFRKQPGHGTGIKVKKTKIKTEKQNSNVPIIDANVVTTLGTNNFYHTGSTP